MTSDSDEKNDIQRLDEKISPVETPADDVENRFDTDPFSARSSLAASYASSEEHSSKAPMPNPLLDFTQAGFSQEILDAIASAQWKAPRTLDSLCLPLTLAGKDVVIHASSKTSAITFLTLADCLIKRKTHANGEASFPQALVIYPSTSAASKGCQDFQRLFSKLSLTAVSLSNLEETGGDRTPDDFSQADIVFADPSSLRNACNKQLNLQGVVLCIGRDVENLLEGGLQEDLVFLLSRLADAQKIIFSGTISKRVRDLADEFLKEPEYISLERERATIPSVSHSSFLCETPNKFKVLLGLLQDQSPKCALVFANSKLTAAWLYHKLLENGYNTELLANELPQTKRVEGAEGLKNSQTKIFVATDFAARDFQNSELSHVYNFDLPDSGEAYLNRMGQVGKETQGYVCSFVCDEYGENYQHVQDLLGQKTPKPAWHKEEYLKIVDKSGNPFLEKNIGYVPKRFDERPHRGGHDRHPQDGERRPPFRGRNDRPERSERSDRPERSERIEQRIERNDRPERSERIEQRIERNDRPERNDRSERSERGDHSERTELRKAGASSKGPQIKPRAPKKIHTSSTQVRPIEQRRVTPKSQNTGAGLLRKFLAFFLPKKKK